MSRKPETGMPICLKQTQWWAIIRKDLDGWYASWAEPEGSTSRTAAGHGGISDEGLSNSWYMLGDEECPELPLRVLISKHLSDLEKLKVLHLLEHINQT